MEEYHLKTSGQWNEQLNLSTTSKNPFSSNNANLDLVNS